MLPIMMRAPGGVHLDVPGTTLEVRDRSDGVVMMMMMMIYDEDDL